MQKDNTIFNHKNNETEEERRERIFHAIGKKKDKNYLPDLNIPVGISKAEYFKKTVYDKAKEKYGEITEEIKSRIECETAAYEKLNYIDYCLIFAELKNHLKQSGAEFFMAGPQCGSIVNYLLGITEQDPLRYGLLFERYINANRRRIVFCPYYFVYADDKNIAKIAKIIKKKYGKYSLLKPKRVWEAIDCNSFIFGKDLEELDIYDEDIKRQKKCLLSLGQANEIGLFTVNVYSEKSMNILEACKEKIQADLNFDFDKCDDEKTWEYISSGRFTNPDCKTEVEGEGDVSSEIKDRFGTGIHDLNELSEYISIGEFGKGLSNKQFIKAYHQYKSLIQQEKLVYQEDCMEIVRKMTDWSLCDCEDFREATGRRRLYDVLKRKFIEDAVKNGYTEEYAEEIIEELKSIAPHIRTKSWTLIYAFNLYKLAYVSLYYPDVYAEVVAKYEII